MDDKKRTTYWLSGGYCDSVHCTYEDFKTKFEEGGIHEFLTATYNDPYKVTIRMEDVSSFMEW